MCVNKMLIGPEQERELACTRLQGKVQVDRSPLSWNLARRVLGRWRWYACSLLVSFVCALVLSARLLNFLLFSLRSLEKRRALVPIT